MTLPQPRTLKNNELSQMRPACIWLDFGDDDECNLLPNGTVDIDWCDHAAKKIVKKSVPAFCRVYDGSEGPYVYDEYKLPITSVRYFKNGEVTEFVTDIHGVLINPL